MNFSSDDTHGQIMGIWLFFSSFMVFALIHKPISIFNLFLVLFIAGLLRNQVKNYLDKYFEKLGNGEFFFYTRLVLEMGSYYFLSFLGLIHKPITIFHLFLI